MAAELLRGRKIAPGLRLLVSPASREIYNQCLREGILEVLAEAGATVLASSCGACLGVHSGAIGDGEVCVSATNRNFIGRMGSKQGRSTWAPPSPWPPPPSQDISRTPGKSEEGVMITTAEKSGNIGQHQHRHHRAARLPGAAQYGGGRPIYHGAGGPDFASGFKPGDIFVAEHNLGSGSSRENAPLTLRPLGVKTIVALDYARIFYRNCINLGILAVECPETGRISEDDVLEIDYQRGVIRNLTTGEELPCDPIPAHIMDLVSRGGLVEYLKTRINA